MNKIDRFVGTYFFLSNFYPVPITYNGVSYLSTEAAYQAQKTTNPSMQYLFSKLNPSEAKSKGKRLVLRPDWIQVKENYMYEICREKFTKDADLKSKLLATGDAYLEEGNDWGDTTWGTVDGVGENKLGKILMRIREELK